MAVRTSDMSRRWVSSSNAQPAGPSRLGRVAAAGRGDVLEEVLAHYLERGPAEARLGAVVPVRDLALLVEREVLAAEEAADHVLVLGELLGRQPDRRISEVGRLLSLRFGVVAVGAGCHRRAARGARSSSRALLRSSAVRELLQTGDVERRTPVERGPARNVAPAPGRGA
jgi:hypothetical protein